MFCYIFGRFLGHGEFYYSVVVSSFWSRGDTCDFFAWEKAFSSKVAGLAVFLLSIHVFFIQNIS